MHIPEHKDSFGSLEHLDDVSHTLVHEKNTPEHGKQPLFCKGMYLTSKKGFEQRSRRKDSMSDKSP